MQECIILCHLYPDFNRNCPCKEVISRIVENHQSFVVGPSLFAGVFVWIHNDIYAVVLRLESDFCVTMCLDRQNVTTNIYKRLKESPSL